jgi:thymidylate synthase (FAD)
MEIVTPRIFHLAGTSVDRGDSLEFLKFHGVPEWSTDTGSAASRLIEMAGRRCYQAWEDSETSVGEINPNLSKVRKGNKEYLTNILKSGHGSVLEHASDTYAIENVTRVFTHEVVRHRLCAFSQESLRFVRPTSLRAYFPEVFLNLPIDVHNQVNAIFNDTFIHLESVQKSLTNILGMDTVKRAFSDKKKLQSAMRRLMPIGMATGIIVTSNHRNWRHLIEMRTSRHAEEEIRLVFSMIAEDLIERHPEIYQDVEVLPVESGPSEYSFAYSKI